MNLKLEGAFCQFKAKKKEGGNDYGFWTLNNTLKKLQSVSSSSVAEAVKR